MAQFARPSSDISAGVWSASSGSDLYAMIDEVTPSDSDYIYGTSDGGTFCEIKLGSLGDPVSAIGHVIRVRAFLDWIADLDLTITLRQGSSTTIATVVEPIGDTWENIVYTLSAAEANSITDYTDLRLRFQCEALLSSEYDVSWAEFEVPDVPATYDITGVTKDKDGNALATCECFLFKMNAGEDDATFIAHTQSNGSGVYLFEDLGDEDAKYFVVAWKDNTPHVFDCTDHVLVPAQA